MLQHSIPERIGSQVIEEDGASMWAPADSTLAPTGNTHDQVFPGNKRDPS
jgi:hypothetical protein